MPSASGPELLAEPAPLELLEPEEPLLEPCPPELLPLEPAPLELLVEPPLELLEPDMAPELPPEPLLLWPPELAAPELPMTPLLEPPPELLEELPVPLLEAAPELLELELELELELLLAEAVDPLLPPLQAASRLAVHSEAAIRLLKFMPLRPRAVQMESRHGKSRFSCDGIRPPAPGDERRLGPRLGGIIGTRREKPVTWPAASPRNARQLSPRGAPATETTRGPAGGFTACLYLFANQNLIKATTRRGFDILKPVWAFMPATAVCNPRGAGKATAQSAATEDRADRARDQ